MNRYLVPVNTVEKELPFYITTIGSLDNDKRTDRPQGHDNFHWLHCVDGKGYLNICGNEFEIKKGMGFLIYPHVPKLYYPTAEPWATYWLTFNGFAVESLLNHLGFSQWEVLYLPSISIYNHYIDEMYRYLSFNKLESSHKATSILYDFLIHLKNCSYNDDKHTSIKKKIQLAVAFFEKNKSKQITLKEAASQVGVSEQYLCRIFKKELNMNPMDYHTRLKIGYAKKLLVKKPELTVKKIAELAGFSNSSYFCFVFKKYEGITPLNFSNMYKLG